MNSNGLNQRETLVLAKLLVGNPVEVDCLEASPYGGLARTLLDAPPAQRPNLFEAELQRLIESESERDAVRRAVFAVDPGADVVDVEVSGYPLTDTGNAESLVAMHGERLRYDHRRRRWLIWTDHRWRPDEDGEITRLAIQSVRHRYHLTAGVQDKEKKRDLIKWALNSESRYKLEAMVKIASNLHPVTDKGDRFDMDSWLVGCPNGVLDLRTGEFRPGKPTDYITLCAGVEYDSEAKAPRWERFLGEIFAGDEELIGFVQRAMGYSFTGDTREQCLFLCWGSGANGKSTMLETIRQAMGDYAANTPFSTFELRQNDSASNDVAALANKRMITASETNEARRLNEARAKAVTGGDPITARFLFGEFFTFVPSFKVWLAMNYKPIVYGTDEGIWRRIRLIPFTVSFRERADKTLSSTLRGELPGVLNWIVEGARQWLANGLQSPSSVLAATREYRLESDVVSQFVEGCCVVHPNASAKGGQLYKAYKSWCEENSEEAMNNTQFGKRIKEHQGISFKRLSGNIWYYGIGLKADDD